MLIEWEGCFCLPLPNCCIALWLYLDCDCVNILYTTDPRAQLLFDCKEFYAKNKMVNMIVHKVLLAENLRKILL